MSSPIDIISCINEQFPTLTPAEKRIAQFILDDVNMTITLPIAELARLTQSSQASVTRFARTVGCKDVRELKLKMKQALAVGQRFIIDSPDFEGAAGVYDAIIRVLDINKRSLEIPLIKQAVSWISEARQIVVIGMGGGSTICASELQNRLFRLGLPVVSHNDGLLVRMICAAVSPRDIVIALSLSGQTPEIVESSAIARHYGARVITITPKQTLLAAEANLVLPLYIEENDSIFKPSASRFAMLALVDVLATETAMTNKAQAKDSLRRIKLALDSHRPGGDRQPIGD